MQAAPKLTIRYFARPDSPDEWPASWDATGAGDLHQARMAAEVALVTTFPTANRFEIIDASGLILHVWPDEMQPSHPRRRPA